MNEVRAARRLLQSSRKETSQLLWDLRNTLKVALVLVDGWHL